MKHSAGMETVDSAATELSILRDAGLALLVVDGTGTIRLASPECEVLFGVRGMAGRRLEAVPGGPGLAASVGAVLRDGGHRDVAVALDGRVLEARLGRQSGGGGVVAVLRDATEHHARVRQLEAEAVRLAEQQARFRELLTKAPFAVGIHSGPDHTCVFANEEFHSWHPLAEPVGTTFEERCFGLENGSTRAILDTAYRTGITSVAKAQPFLNARPGGGSEMRYFTGIAQPYAGPDGATAGVMTITYEVTEDLRQRQRDELMVSELRHRVKNLLAIVQAVAAFSAINATDKEDLLARFQERIEAIGRANSQLITSDRGARTLGNLIAQEMEQLGPEMRARMLVTGEDPRLPAGLASVIVLALHELINNAVKHGAFSVAEGRVEVAVALEGGEYRLEWRERSAGMDLPAVPESEGFGMLLLRELIAGEVGGEARLTFRREGIDYVLRFPAAGGES